MVKSTDTVDITDLVEKTRSTFVTWAADYLYAALATTPSLAPVLAFPGVGIVVKAALKLALNKLSETAVMIGFFTNTVLRKTTQASDFAKAASAVANLPKDVSNADYAKAEAAKMAAFSNFVALSN